MSEPGEFDPFAMCAILNEEGVDYVVFGGFAAILRGSPVTTHDLDVIPARERANLDRLGRALTRMNAKIRVSGDAVATRIDGAFLANMPHMLNLVTDFGEMDLTFTPAGSTGEFDGWCRGATSEEIEARCESPQGSDGTAVFGVSARRVAERLTLSRRGSRQRCRGRPRETAQLRRGSSAHQRRSPVVAT